MEKIQLATWGGVIIDQELWFSNAYFNALCSLDLLTLNVQIRGVFPLGKLLKKDLHYDVYAVGEDVVFTPQNDNTVRIFNREKGEFISVDNTTSAKPPYTRSVRCGDDVFFVSDNGYVLFYSIENKKIYVDDYLTAQYKEYLLKFGKGIATTVYDEGFVFLRWEETCALKMDLNSKDVETVNIPKLSPPGNMLTSIQDDYYLFTTTGKDIYKYSPTRKEIKELDCVNTWGKETFKTIMNSKLKKIGEDIYATTYNGRCLLKIANDCVTSIASANTEFVVQNANIWGPIYTDIVYDDRFIYFLPYDSNALLRYDVNSSRCDSIEFEVEKNQVWDNISKDYVREHIDNGIINENTINSITIREYLRYLCADN